MPPRGAWRSYLAVLRLPDYRMFWSGLLLSALGSEIGYLALIWFVKDQTQSALAVGLVISLRQIPGAIGSVLGGPLLDRGSRRLLMATDNAGRALLTLTMCLLYFVGVLQLWQIYVVVAVSGLLASLTNVGRGAITPALVGTGDLLPAANALNQVEWQVSSLAGPALGGMLLAFWSAPTILLVDVATLVIFAWSLWHLPKSVDLLRRSTAGYRQSLLHGARLMVGSRPLLALTLLTFLFNAAYGPLLVALPFYADERLGYGAPGLGWLWSAFAVGSLAGGLTASLFDRWPLGRGLSALVLLWGLLTAPLFWVHGLLPALVLMAVAGASYTPYSVLYLTARQRLAPVEAYGRVLGFTLVVTQLGAPLGAWLGGWLVEWVGAAATIGLAGVACVLSGGVAWLQPDLRRLEQPVATVMAPQSD